MKMKNIICLILAVVMVASLSACASAAVPSGVDEQGRFVYAVVRAGENVVAQAETAAKDIRSTLKDNFECKITIAKDHSREDFDENYEILVGDTNREESAEAKQRLLDNRDNNASDFIVAVINDKVCINAITDDMITVAADWFIYTFCGSPEDWSTLKKDYEYIYAPEAQPMGNMVNGVNLGRYAVVLPRKTSLMVGMAADEFVDLYYEYDYIINEREDIDEALEYEILFGDCDREASKSVSVEGDNYVIKVVGNKIVIKGGSVLATWRAAQAFMEEVKKYEGQATGFNWSDGHTINGKYDANEEGTYTLNWYDEFEGSKIDYTKWGDYKNEAARTPTASALGGKLYNNNLFGESLYTGSDKNKNLIYQSDGYLVCGTQRVNDVDFFESYVSTYWTMTYKYGVLDIYSQLAPDPAYTTYWLNGDLGGKEYTDRFGITQNRVCFTEVDILENYSRDYEYGSTVHWWWTDYKADGTKMYEMGHKGLGGSVKYKKGSKNSSYLIYNKEKYGDLLPDDFHMYSMYWDDKCMKFAFDGKVFLNYQYTDNESVSVHCLMNYFITSCGMGNASYGHTYDKDDHGDYYEHKMDYIRLYQTDSINSQLITAWPQKQEKGTATVFYPENSIGNEY